MAFLFGDCVLDPNRRELTRGAEPVVIGPQVFDLLIYLVQNRDRVTSKDELLNAVWGGRVVSESTITSHINAVRKAIGDSGEEQRLIRTIPRKGFRFVADVTQSNPDEETPSSSAPAVPANSAPETLLPDRPAIAVLPFRNLTGDSEQEYFTDGMTEEIISALSRIRWLFVIARNSTFTYKGHAVDIKRVGRELGVRYVLEGSVRKADNRVRITGQLVDAATGINLWADRFQGDLDNVFDLQDHLARAVVGTIAPQVERAEMNRAKRKPTSSLDAYDYYLRGTARFHQATRESIESALSLFRAAIELDADFASAWGMASWCLYWGKMNRWITSRSPEMAEGARLAREAVERGKNDAVALTRGGHALAHFGGDLDQGIASVNRALVLDPNLAAAWYLSAFQRISCGEHDDAIERFAHAMRLSPLDPETFQMQTGMAMAHMFAGRFDQATSWSSKARRELPDVLRVAAFSAASHALADRMNEAKAAMLHVRKLDPNLCISDIEGWVVLRRPQDLATFIEGLRKAGLPE